MASGSSASLALKAAVAAAVLAVLVPPSMARGPSLASTTAPAPGVKCDCSYCIPRCDATVAQKCSQYCGASSCDDCKSGKIAECRKSCKGSSCDACVNNANYACGGICYGSTCADCMRGTRNQCSDDCNVQCHAGCGSRL